MIARPAWRVFFLMELPASADFSSPFGRAVSEQDKAFSGCLGLFHNAAE